MKYGIYVRFAIDSPYIKSAAEALNFVRNFLDDSHGCPDYMASTSGTLSEGAIQVSDVSAVPTRYAVICQVHGRVYMTKEEYDRQIWDADDLWKCPECGSTATFDNENYDRDN